MGTSNEIWLDTAKGRERLDLDDDTQLLPSFQANDRTKPDTLQSDYSPEFSVPGSTHNHRLLKHAAASQPAPGQAYVRLPCVLTSGGVETLPLALLYLKGYKEGRYQLQLAGGNRRLVEALKKDDGSDKMLSDLDLNRYNHTWNPANVAAGLPYAHWQAEGWGYEAYDRGKPVDFQALNPYDLYPSCSDRLIWQQILADAGFTADDLLSEPLAAALNVPAPNPFTYSQDYRDARRLQAGYFYSGLDGLLHQSEFAPEKVVFGYTTRKPYHLPEPTTGASYFAGEYTVDTLGLYDVAASVNTYFGCRKGTLYFGEVSCKWQLFRNGAPVVSAADPTQQLGTDELRIKGFQQHTFTPKLSRITLYPGDKISLYWQGDEWPGRNGFIDHAPSDTYWQVGPYGAQVPLKDGQRLANEAQFTVNLLAEFPQGGTVKLQEWLPEMKQLDYVKARMLLLGLTIMTDAFEPHLHLAPGSKLLSPEQVAKAKNWTAKRDAYAQPGRLPERDLAFRFGSYGRENFLKWTEDEHVPTGYGDGSITIADASLPATYDLAKLPFAASSASPDVVGLLQLLNFEVADPAADPLTYNKLESKPKLTLRRADGEVGGQLITTPAVGQVGHDGYVPPVTVAVTTTVSYFAGVDLSLELNSTVLTEYWQDLRAMFEESRYLTEYYRLTPQDVAELDFSVPIWDGGLGDFFAVSVVGEYDARRPVEVRLCRLNAKYLPPPVVPGDGSEWYAGEFWLEEFY